MSISTRRKPLNGQASLQPSTKVVKCK